MKLKAVLYIGLLSLGVGCSNNDPRLDGEREMLDGSVFVESDARFLVESLPALNLPDERRNTQWTHQGGNAQHYTESRNICCISGSSFFHVSRFMVRPPGSEAPSCRRVIKGATSNSLNGRIPTPGEITPSAVPFLTPS